MSTFDILRPGVWFGPKYSSVGEPDLSQDDEVVALQQVCQEMKSGDFRGRSELVSLISRGENPSVRTQSIRLFCYTCRHTDVSNIFDIMPELSHDDVITIIGSSPDTLSAEAIPYLFAMLEHESFSLDHENILDSIDRMFPWGYEGGEVDLAWLAERFSGFATRLEHPDMYYYAGLPVHPGNLCKMIIETAALSNKSRKLFPLSIAPMLLSIWSGERCPIYYGDELDDQKIAAIMDYVGIIASMPWKDGEKCFYGNVVS